MARRRRRWLRAALIALLALAALAAGAVVYVQTPDGFTRVVVPLLDRLIDGSLTVRSGRFRLNGALQASGTVFRNESGSFSIEVDSLSGRLDLFPLLRGAPVVIDSAHITGVRMESRSPATDEHPGDDVSSALDLAPWLLVPVEVRRGDIDRLTVHFRKGDRTQAIVGPARVGLNGFAPDSVAALEIESDVSLAPDAEGPAYARQISPDARVGLDGRLRARTLEASLRWELNRSGAPGRGSLRGNSTASGSASAAGKIEISLTTALQSAGEALGRIDTHLRVDPNGLQAPLELLIQAVDIRAPALNPLVALSGGGRLEDGRVDARIDIRPAGERGVAFDSVIDGKALRLQPNGADSALPALDLHSEQRGAWSYASGQLHLDTFRLVVETEGRPRITVDLIAPASLDLDPEGGDAVRADPVKLNASIDAVEVRQLRSWLAVFGGDPLSVIGAGEIGGSVRAQLDGSQVSLSGDLQVRDFELATSSAPPPFDLRARLSGTIAGARLKIAEAHLDASREGIFLSGEVHGTLDLPADAVDVTWEIRVPNLPQAGVRLGMIPNALAGRLGGGSATARGRLTRGSAEDAYDIRADVIVRELHVSGAGGTRTIHITGTAEAGLPTSGNRLALRAVQADVRTSGIDKPGTIFATGTIPLGPSTGEEPLEVSIRLDDFLAAPWLRLAGLEMPASQGSLPFSGSADVHVDATTFAIRGKQIVQLRSLDRTEAGQPIEIQLAESVTRRLDASLEFSGEATAVRSGRADDRLQISGTYSGPPFTEGPRILQLDADIINLDLAAYYARPQEPTAAERSQTDAAESAAAADDGADESAGFVLPFARLHLDLSVDRARYEAAEVEAGHLRARISEDDWSINLSPTKAFAGTTSGEIIYRIADGTHSATWSVEAQGLNLDHVRHFLQLSENSQVAGLLDFCSSARGVAATTPSSR